MGRLTRKHESGEFYIPRRYKDENGNNIVPSNQTAIDKLAHYEDLEEQGRLIELPCAVGDTVYFVDEYGIGGVKEYEVGCIVLKGNADYSRRLWQDVYGGELGNFEDIGKTVFLTKEEAEKKLQELKGNE